MSDSFDVKKANKSDLVKYAKNTDRTERELKSVIVYILKATG